MLLHYIQPFIILNFTLIDYIKQIKVADIIS